ncbi:MAG TPA: DUF4013 domain-containing protein [Chloroflexi bacterium]|nr:MAG: hypothetical protein B6243_06835 [Anaerolineaceae bacterium 4572_5.2]HEY84812.1 DUF4013 domain-containing protein [Chloroflexota bacterium]
MDVAKAFTFVTEDERWMGKIGIGALVALLSFLIIPIPLLVGYMVGVVRNVKDGVVNPMPEWDNWGLLFKDGLSIIVAQLVYTLPFWLLSCIAGVGTVGMGSLAETNEDLAAAGIFATFGLVGCLTLVFMVALFFLSPAIVIQYVRTNELGAAFRFGEVFAIAKENVGNILIIALVTFVIAIVLNIVIGILGLIPCIGWVAALIIAVAAGPYMTVVTGHLYGQIAE